MDRPTYYDRADSMILDAVTVAESGTDRAAVRPPMPAGIPAVRRTQLTVLGVLDQSLTGMGGRLLRQRFAAPLHGSQRDRAAPGMRWANCCSRPFCAPNCASNWEASWIWNGCLSKVTLGSAGPARPVGARPIAGKDSRLSNVCFDTQQAARLRHLHDRLDELPDVCQPDPGSHRRRGRR